MAGWKVRLIMCVHYPHLFVLVYRNTHTTHLTRSTMKTWCARLSPRHREICHRELESPQNLLHAAGARKSPTRFLRSYCLRVDSTAAAPASSTVFVGNLSWSTTSDDLKAFMASLGEVVSAEVQSHADSGRSKGWG